jgi:nitrile hydratase accessory protein
MPSDKLSILPRLPRDDDGPVFAAPWQAQAFALGVKLNEAGVFTWSEWAATLGSELAAAGPDDTVDAYYEHWLTALEKLVEQKGALGHDERLARRDAWDRAARATPHGEPIVLGRGD